MYWCSLLGDTGTLGVRYLDLHLEFGFGFFADEQSGFRSLALSALRASLGVLPSRSLNPFEHKDGKAAPLLSTLHPITLDASLVVVTAGSRWRFLGRVPSCSCPTRVVRLQAHRPVAWTTSMTLSFVWRAFAAVAVANGRVRSDDASVVIINNHLAAPVAYSLSAQPRVWWHICSTLYGCPAGLPMAGLVQKKTESEELYEEETAFCSLAIYHGLTS